MKQSGLVVAMLIVAALALATHNAVAEEPALYPAECFTVEAAKPYAPLAQSWMRTQQARGATGFIVSGHTVCAY